MAVGEMQEIILQRMTGGDSLDDVEGQIDTAPGLSSDQKAALWLYAWSLMSPRRQEYEARKWLRIADGMPYATD